MPRDIYSRIHERARTLLLDIDGCEPPLLTPARIPEAHLSGFDRSASSSSRTEVCVDGLIVWRVGNYVNLTFDLDFFYPYIEEYLDRHPRPVLHYDIHEDELFEPVNHAIYRLHGIRPTNHSAKYADAAGIVWRTLAIGALPAYARSRALNSVADEWLKWSYAPGGKKPCQCLSAFGARSLYNWKQEV